MRIFVHDIAARQLAGDAVGTVLRAKSSALRRELLILIEQALEDYEFPVNGQGVVKLHDDACQLVLAGVARIPQDLSAAEMGLLCGVRVHRGEPVVVLKRGILVMRGVDLAPSSVRAVVYTKEAYLSDPQITVEEQDDFQAGGYTHCLVTLLTGVEGHIPVPSSRRFVRNLAGGNVKYRQLALDYAVERPDFLDKLEKEAKAIVEYEQSWMLVG